MDLFEKCRRFTTARDAIAGGYYPFFVAFENSDGATAKLHGEDIVMAGSNNYLGLTTDPRVLAASYAALEESGSSCTGSRLLNGNLRLHEELEAELASFLGKQAALVFSTGYGANLGTLGAIVGRKDEVILDKEAHASAVDGVQTSGARVRLFRHNDVDDLRSLLRRTDSAHGRLVVVDGVYSMGGDLAPLPDVVQVCQDEGASLLVDDAHGAGVIGHGRGTVAHFGVTDHVDLVTLTFSKSFASIGGAVAGDDDAIHFLRHHARSEIYSASMTPANTAAALAAVKIARAEPWRADQVLANARHVHGRLLDLGLDVGPSDSPVLPVHTRDDLTTVFLWKRLLELGLYTNAVIQPAASPRLRVSLMATHTTAHLDHIVDAFRQARDEGLAPLAETAAA